MGLGQCERRLPLLGHRERRHVARGRWVAAGDDDLDGGEEAAENRQHLAGGGEELGRSWGGWGEVGGRWGGRA